MEALILLVIVVGIVYFALTRLVLPQRCPGCGRAQVPGRDACPFCETPYQAFHPVLPPGACPYLTGLAGEGQGQRFEIGDYFSLGRDEDNNLCLDAPYVSSYHAVIVLQSGRYVLYDRNSTGGTYVNGRRIMQHVLRPGDRIQIGSSVFAFLTPAPPAVTPSLDWLSEGIRGLTIGRKVSGAGALLALFCFFMPWIVVSCGVQVTMSGLDLATSSGQLNTPSWILFLVPIMTVAILWVIYSALGRPGPGLKVTANRILAFSGLGLLSVILTYIAVQRARNDLANLGLGALIQLDYGFWGTAMGFVASIIGALLDQKEGG